MGLSEEIGIGGDGDRRKRIGDGLGTDQRPDPAGDAGRIVEGPKWHLPSRLFHRG